MTPTLNVIIVNWNTGKQLADCLESIATADRSGFTLSNVIVVDNASTDDSLNGIDSIDIPLKIIRCDRNLGFAAACNRGASECSSDYILFLNPDMKLYSDSLAEPIVFMRNEDNEDVGVCGISLINEDGQVARSCARFPKVHMFINNMLGLDQLAPSIFKSHVMREWAHDGDRYVDHVIGAYYLIRRPVFEKLGGFDERFFIYLEDLDLSYRASKEGWKAYYLSQVKAYHRGGGVSDQIKARRLFYSLNSRIIYGFKHFGRIKGALLYAGTLILEPFIRIAWSIRRMSASQLKDTIKAYLMLWRSLFFPAYRKKYGIC